MNKREETQTEGLLSIFLQERRIKAALPFLTHGQVLDFGCGNGELAKYIEPSRYLGIDINPRAVDISRIRFPSHSFLTNEEYATYSRQFDRIAALAVVEHLQEPTVWFNWWQSNLQPNGLLIVTTPDPSFRKVHEFGAEIGIFSKVSAKEHNELLNSDQIRKLAQFAGFHIDEVRRFLGGANQLFVLNV